MSANVLIIGNKPESQKMIENYFKEISCNVYSAADKGGGMKLFGEKYFNLVLCNLSASVLDGIEVIRQIKKKRPEASIVAYTDKEKAVELSFAKEFGADRVLSRPFSKEKLLDTLNSIGYFISTD